MSLVCVVDVAVHLSHLQVLDALPHRPCCLRVGLSRLSSDPQHAACVPLAHTPPLVPAHPPNQEPDPAPPPVVAGAWMPPGSSPWVDAASSLFYSHMFVAYEADVGLEQLVVWRLRVPAAETVSVVVTVELLCDFDKREVDDEPDVAFAPRELVWQQLVLADVHLGVHTHLPITFCPPFTCKLHAHCHTALTTTLCEDGSDGAQVDCKLRDVRIPMHLVSALNASRPRGDAISRRFANETRRASIPALQPNTAHSGPSAVGPCVTVHSLFRQPPEAAGAITAPCPSCPPALPPVPFGDVLSRFQEELNDSAVLGTHAQNSTCALLTTLLHPLLESFEMLWLATDALSELCERVCVYMQDPSWLEMKDGLRAEHFKADRRALMVDWLVAVEALVACCNPDRPSEHDEGEEEEEDGDDDEQKQQEQERVGGERALGLPKDHVTQITIGEANGKWLADRVKQLERSGAGVGLGSLANCLTPASPFSVWGMALTSVSNQIFASWSTFQGLLTHYAPIIAVAMEFLAAEKDAVFWAHTLFVANLPVARVGDAQPHMLAFLQSTVARLRSLPSLSPTPLVVPVDMAGLQHVHMNLLLEQRFAAGNDNPAGHPTNFHEAHKLYQQACVVGAGGASGKARAGSEPAGSNAAPPLQAPGLAPASRGHSHSAVLQRMAQLATSAITIPSPISARQGGRSHPSSRVLFVLVHGLLAGPTDMEDLQAHLRLMSPLSGFLLVRSLENHTMEDIASLGQRVATEVHEAVVQAAARYRWINFVCHSLGGVVVRAALNCSVMDPHRRMLHSFVSLATPHLGTVGAKGSLVDAGMRLLQTWARAASLTQLALRDQSDPQQTFLYSLSAQGGLSWFRHVVLFASPDDGYVPFSSAFMQVCDSAHGAQGAVQEMVEHLDEHLQRVGAKGTVSRVCVSFGKDPDEPTLPKEAGSVGAGSRKSGRGQDEGGLAAAASDRESSGSVASSGVASVNGHSRGSSRIGNAAAHDVRVSAIAGRLGGDDPSPGVRCGAARKTKGVRGAMKGLGRSVDDWIGRTPHVRFLADRVFLKQLTVLYRDRLLCPDA